MDNFKTPLQLCVDAYQATHFEIIPDGMENFQCSQVIHRKPLYDSDHRIISAGLSQFVKNFLTQRITIEDIDKAEEFYKDFAAGGKPYPWPKHIFQTVVDKYDGYLPITIAGLKDGQTHYFAEPCVQVWTNEPGMGELVGWIESELLPYLWSMSVVATRGRKIKEKMLKFWKLTVPGTDEELLSQIQYFFHDFGRRGAACSQMTGIAHLINWLGTDTMDAAYIASKEFNNGEKFGACSIRAAAHRTITTHATEKEAYEKMIQKYKSEFFSAPTDSYDYTKGTRLFASYANQVKEAGGYLIVRPDSGDPTECILKGLEILNEYFGHTVNSLGYKKINNAGVIQGDGITEEVLFEQIYPSVVAKGWALNNLAVGMGQGNHKANRSMLETAYKTCTVGTQDGKYRPVMKFSESPFKRSLPCPVVIHTDINTSHRIYPISVTRLLSKDLYNYHIYYENGKIDLPLFAETRNLALKTWTEHSLVRPYPETEFFNEYFTKLITEYQDGLATKA